MGPYRHGRSLPVFTLLFLFVARFELTSCQHYEITPDEQFLRLDPVIVDVRTMCKTYQGLSRKQMALCRKFPDITMAAMQGLQLSIHECQHQLRKHRWNCSSLSTKSRNPRASAIFSRGYRETALARAITSAGVMHAVARACSQGVAISCGCDVRRRGYGKRGWSWAGCSDNAQFGAHFSRLLMDSRDKAKDLHSKVGQHNNNVGRQAVTQNMEIRCKCHGMSGSCEMKTCWRSTSNFRRVGGVLKEKYNYAMLVDPINTGSDVTLRLAYRSSKRKPRFTDLIYYEKSPTFCESDPTKDSAGTKGRMCNKTSFDIDNCGALCCGRGYNTQRRIRREKCQCRFHWCCYVECQECVYEDWVTVCK